jgi:flagellar biosynthesis GTPase FlhF
MPRSLSGETDVNTLRRKPALLGAIGLMCLALGSGPAWAQGADAQQPVEPDPRARRNPQTRPAQPQPQPQAQPEQRRREERPRVEDRNRADDRTRNEWRERRAAEERTRSEQQGRERQAAEERARSQQQQQQQYQWRERQGAEERARSEQQRRAAEDRRRDGDRRWDRNNDGRPDSFRARDRDRDGVPDWRDRSVGSPRWADNRWVGPARREIWRDARWHAYSHRVRPYRNVVVFRPYGGWYHGYGRYYQDDQAYRWLGLTAITFGVLGMLNEMQQRALEDAQIAATTAPIGAPIAWGDPYAHGTVIATREGMSESGQYCREFQQTVQIGGRVEQAFGTACQQPDGAWLVVHSS